MEGKFGTWCSPSSVSLQDWTRTIWLVQQAPLPTEQSCQAQTVRLWPIRESIISLQNHLPLGKRLSEIYNEGLGFIWITRISTWHSPLHRERHPPKASKSQRVGAWDSKPAPPGPVPPVLAKVTSLTQVSSSLLWSNNMRLERLLLKFWCAENAKDNTWHE